MRVDYLIVGAGIAGSVLADHLLKAGKEVMVVDDATKSNSSKVAGGLYNPITGRQMVKTWNCDRLFDYLIPYYKGLETELKTNFLFDTPIYRPFFSIEEQNEWMAKSAENQYSNYIKEIKSKPEWTNEVSNPYGGLLLSKSGYLDTSVFLEAFKDKLRRSKKLIESDFHFTQLQKLTKGYSFKGVTAKRIIFCDGRLGVDNPYFSWLPFSLVKGELLFMKSDVSPRVIYNRGVFVIPLGNGFMKCGSTYEHNELNELPTKKAKDELIQRVEKLINFDFEVIDQKAGVRPATKDRKPFIGEHPVEKGIWIFNGLGTKGVSLAPFYAKQLVEHMEDDQPLDAEVNIERFFSLF
ncbi:MAG: FAD-binding oxidoreductase [Roseivirga sp.]|jgi:glycine/D-amino acid oxidase-like deaminating enzyme|uniref:NAD(P)/FAD-dependent oxidoreductase n=1 Tax=Roseivirga sp. TaxID=1964215 RepID=UPI001B2E4794|nr:FAD-dependent oxidoreductase [Roseivirga sp.]MBO6495149.1 FAD-binding oxidoreductase [Roseivirga sp.]